MDTAKSHVIDGRVVTITIVTVDEGIKMTIKTQKADGQETTTEFTSKLNGKACEAADGTHKSQMTVWYKRANFECVQRGGAADDVTSVWKFELAPDKQMMTMKINHYEPPAETRRLCLRRKVLST